MVPEHKIYYNSQYWGLC